MSAPRWACRPPRRSCCSRLHRGVSHTALGCTAPQEITRFRVRLPNTASAIRSGKALVIVAIGSSSTEGVGASDAAHAIRPARRRAAPPLAAALGDRDQQGVGGEMAFQMLARFERDVLPYTAARHLQTGSTRR